MNLICNQYLSFREAYEIYVQRVPTPVTEGAVRRWLSNGTVHGIKRGNTWQLQVQDLIRYHVNKIGRGKKGRKGRLRRDRIESLSEFQLDEREWLSHFKAFLSDRKVVRPRQLLDLVGVSKAKLTPEVKGETIRAKEVLRRLGWQQMPEPHSYDWAPKAIVRKAKAKQAVKARSAKEIAAQARTLLRWLKTGGMYTLPEISKHSKLTASQAQGLIRLLLDEGKLATLGQASMTLYYHP